MFTDTPDGQTYKRCATHQWGVSVNVRDGRRKTCQVCGLKAPREKKSVNYQPPLKMDSDSTKPQDTDELVKIANGELKKIIADIANELRKLKEWRSDSAMGQDDAELWFDSIISKLNDI